MMNVMLLHLSFSFCLCKSVILIAILFDKPVFDFPISKNQQKSRTEIYIERIEILIIQNKQTIFCIVIFIDKIA